ncbi:MAG: hypothetical protein WA817_11765, partial [Candidatus Acidiferrum sp.]
SRQARTYSGQVMTNAPGRARPPGIRLKMEKGGVMTTVMTHEPSTDKPDRRGVAALLLVPGFWGSVSIIAMWLAVMFDGIFGGDMVFRNNTGGGPTIIPSAVLLGLFAVIGTVSIAKRVFGRRDAG